MNVLYFAPGACSFVPHVALERIKEVSGQEYEPRMVKLHKGEQKSAEFLAMNPDGQVPVLLERDRPLTQILAICDALDRQCPQAQLLPAGATRSEAFSALAWMNNSLHPTFTHVFMPQIFTDDPEAQAKIKSYNVSRYRQYLQRLDDMANGKKNLWFGDQLSFHDAYAFTLLRWGGLAGIDPTGFPNLKALVERAMGQSAMATVLARERVALDTFKG
jgi:glutathione S-transferase